VSIGKLKFAIKSGVAPNTTEQLGGLLDMGSPRELGADHGSCMMGWLVPPIIGEYVFWIAAEDNSEL
jgi:hypothetical protein